jgi:uncharacterized membrane protein
MFAATSAVSMSSGIYAGLILHLIGSQTLRCGIIFYISIRYYEHMNEDTIIIVAVAGVIKSRTHQTAGLSCITASIRRYE